MSEPEGAAATGRQWWRDAQEDLQVAQALHDAEPMFARAVCLHAQQAAEKALKAALVFVQTDFPRTHALQRLARLLPHGWTRPGTDDDLVWLTTWAVGSRYPDTAADATAQDAERALALAREVAATIQGDLVRLGRLT